MDEPLKTAFAQQMWYAPTVENVQLPPEFVRKIAFSAEERANFFRQNFDYLRANQHRLLDWWTRIFKAHADRGDLALGQFISTFCRFFAHRRLNFTVL